MLRVMEADGARLRELNIVIEDMGTYIVVREYPPTPSGGPSRVLYRARHEEVK